MQTAYRLYLWRELGHGARLCLEALHAIQGGHVLVASLPEPELEMTVEEEAGAILEAEMADDLSRLRRYYETVHKGE